MFAPGCLPRSRDARDRVELANRDDGSMELHFGPTPPTAGESNWIPTPERRRLEALFRFYGPTPQLYDHTWILPDIEGTATNLRH
ncbi:DUF1214 domain-containing protein [Nocardia salmonicida]|uniref:DUF1214 domain-containing protein n=1 Tax=Nocardia salmonicida TaxID=53431 RepID=UPI003428357B